MCGSFPASVTVRLVGIPITGAVAHEGWFDRVCPVHSVARLTMRGSTVSTPSNIEPHAYVCIGFRISLSSDRIGPAMKDYLLRTNAARVARHARCSVLVARE